ncbi:DnaJ domain-containing protein [Syncephalis plumigaleata]|nr:DnaJ domain-containing protein [Syncephalis plumigaleata]
MEETPDYFAILEVSTDADERAIRRAYRSKALRYHPDKNPNDRTAADIFLKLTKAYEALTDPEARRKHLSIHATRLKKTQRTAAMDSERQRMKRELEEREQDAKQEVRLWSEIERLRADAAKLEKDQREREELARMASMDATALQEKDAATNTDATLKVRCKSKKETLTEEQLTKLFSVYGELEHVLISSKASKKKSALVAFKTVAGAHAAMIKADLPGSPLAAFSLSWAGGEEPALVRQLNEASVLADTSKKSTESTRPAIKAFSFKPAAVKLSANDYESLTLMRMRQAERKRLEAEIRQQEDAEEESNE